MPTSSSIASREELSNGAADSGTTDEENDQIKAILNHGQSTINYHALDQIGAICALGDSINWKTTNKDGTEVMNPQYEEFQSLRQEFKDAYKSIPVKSTEELRSSGWATKVKQRVEAAAQKEQDQWMQNSKKFVQRLQARSETVNLTKSASSTQSGVIGKSGPLQRVLTGWKSGKSIV